MSLKNLLLTSLVCTALLPLYAVAAGVEVRVVDTAGRALPGAVVSAYPEAQRDKVMPQPAQRPQAVMDQRDKQFVPRVLPVQVGTAVSFPNSDDIRHHVYSFSKPKRFEIKLYHGTPSEPIVFDEPGVVTLGCNIHDQMLGFIYITDSNHYTQTDAAGMARLEQLAPGRHEIRVWHPDMGAETLPAVVQTELSDAAPVSVRVQVQTRPEEPPELTPLERKFRQQSQHVH